MDKKNDFLKKTSDLGTKSDLKKHTFPRNIDIYRFMGKNRLSLNDLKINVLFPEMCIVTKIWIKKTTFSKKRRRYGHKNVIKNALFLKILTVTHLCAKIGFLSLNDLKKNVIFPEICIFTVKWIKKDV